MFPKPLLLASISLLTLFSGISAQNVGNKNVLFPNGLSFNENGLWNAFPGTPNTRTVRRAWGTLPRFCYRASIPDIIPDRGQHCNPYDVEVYEVSYDDCGADSWTFCRCNNSPWSLNDMINLFGRLPVRARQHTRTLASFGLTAQDNGGGWAYAYGPDISVMDSASKGGLRPTLMMHENAHTVDYGLSWLSDEGGYINAINNDQCVPDPYARSNNVENYAQVSVLGNYDLSGAGPLSRYADPGCLNDQLAWVENAVRNKLSPGGSCEVYWPAEESVCMGPAAGCGNAGQSVRSAAAVFNESAIDAGVAALEMQNAEPRLIVDTVEGILAEEEALISRITRESGTY